MANPNCKWCNKPVDNKDCWPRMVQGIQFPAVHIRCQEYKWLEAAAEYSPMAREALETRKEG